MRGPTTVLLSVFLFALGVGLGGSPMAYLVLRRSPLVQALAPGPDVRATVVAREAEVAASRRERLRELLTQQIGEYESVPTRYAGPSADSARALWRRYVLAAPDERARLSSATGSSRTIVAMIELHRAFILDPDNELLRRYVDWRTRQGLDEYRALANAGGVEEFVDWLLALE